MYRRLACFLVALLLPAWAQALPVTTGVSNPTIVVALIATLSGPGSMAGQDSVDGFSTAMRHLGGRFANQEVRVVVLDDKGSPDTAQMVVRRLLEREKVDFVVTAVSLPSMAAMLKPLSDSRAFVLNLDAVPTAVAGAECSPWFFQVATPAEAEFDGLAAHLVAEKMRRVAIVGPADSPTINNALAAIRRVWPGEVAQVLRPRHGATTFPGEIAALRQAAPDAVLTLLTGGMGVAFAREYAAAGLKADMPLIGLWQGWERPLLTAMTDAGLDVLNVAPWSPDLDTPLNKRLVTDFELEFGRPVTGWVAQGYDTAQLLESAMRATGGRTGDRDAVRHGLRRAEFPSVRGTFRFDTNHYPSVNLYMRRVVRDAKGRLNEELRATLIRDWHSRDVALCPMRWVEEPTLPAGAKPGTPPKPSATAPAKPPAPKAPAIKAPAIRPQ